MQRPNYLVMALVVFTAFIFGRATATGGNHDVAKATTKVRAGSRHYPATSSTATSKTATITTGGQWPSGVTQMGDSTETSCGGDTQLHTVQAGETLFGIVVANVNNHAASAPHWSDPRTATDIVARVNGIADPTLIYENQHILLPQWCALTVLD